MANAAFIKRKVANINPDSAKNNEQLSLTWREFMLIYNMPGGREAFENIFEELFVKAYEDKDGKLCYEFEDGKISYFDGNDENGKRRWIERRKDESYKYKGLGLAKEAPEKLKIFIQWRETIMERLKKELEKNGAGELEAELEARAAFASAWNIIFNGNAIESADHERLVSPSIVYGEQIRANMHPLSKAKAKYKLGREREIEEVGTEEGWGGILGTWLAERVVRDSRFREKLEDGEIKPFPETMLTSFFEAIKDKSRKGKTLAERFLAKERVVCKPEDEGGDMFGEYVDIWDSAYKGYTYATGKIPLERMNKREIQDWTRGLADIIAKLGGKGFTEYYQDHNYLMFCICSAIGLRTHTSHLVLAIPNRFYDIYLDAILNPRLLTPFKNPRRIKSRIKHDLNAGFGGSIKREIIDLERSFESVIKP